MLRVGSRSRGIHAGPRFPPTPRRGWLPDRDRVRAPDHLDPTNRERIHLPPDAISSRAAYRTDTLRGSPFRTAQGPELRAEVDLCHVRVIESWYTAPCRWASNGSPAGTGWWSGPRTCHVGAMCGDCSGVTVDCCWMSWLLSPVPSLTDTAWPKHSSRCAGSTSRQRNRRVDDHQCRAVAYRGQDRVEDPDTPKRRAVRCWMRSSVMAPADAGGGVAGRGRRLVEAHRGEVDDQAGGWWSVTGFTSRGSDDGGRCAAAARQRQAHRRGER